MRPLISAIICSPLLVTVAANAQQPVTGPPLKQTQTILIAPADARIQYTGRWDRTNPAEAWCGWQGSSILVRFVGKSITADLDPGNSREYFRTVVDGDYLNSTKFPVQTGRAKYTLASGLPNGIHVVELIKETNAGTEATFYGLELDGARLLSPPQRPVHRIEFYGDSNLAGYSLEDERNLSGNSLIGTTFGYAGIVSRMFDAEYHNISASGATISSLHSRFDRIEWGSPNPQWDFGQFPAELVVVNLGANDVWRPKTQIKSDYHALLDDLRSMHPAAHVVLFNAYGWDFEEPANYTHEVIQERTDPNMSAAVFPWFFEKWHGCEYDHGGMAQVLAEHITSIMGWVPTASDVMNGYGQGGDVANGGFEEIAPFGGYGWRYFTDLGVDRIFSPNAAYEGNHYVRLTNQAKIHQPNGASGGNVVTATLWLRSSVPGGTAKVTIDFRNQQMYTSPLQSTTTPLTLGTTWQPYVVFDTAPLGGTPVFHTRLTVQASPGSQVDVDGISMSVQ